MGLPRSLRDHGPVPLPLPLPLDCCLSIKATARWPSISHPGRPGAGAGSLLSSHTVTHTVPTQDSMARPGHRDTTPRTVLPSPPPLIAAWFPRPGCLPPAPNLGHLTQSTTLTQTSFRVFQFPSQGPFPSPLRSGQPESPAVYLPLLHGLPTPSPPSRAQASVTTGGNHNLLRPPRPPHLPPPRTGSGEQQPAWGATCWPHKLTAAANYGWFSSCIQFHPLPQKLGRDRGVRGSGGSEGSIC